MDGLSALRLGALENRSDQKCKELKNYRGRVFSDENYSVARGLCLTLNLVDACRRAGKIRMARKLVSALRRHAGSIGNYKQVCCTDSIGVVSYFLFIYIYIYIYIYNMVYFTVPSATT